uniref:secretory carrier-associated membrane protein 1-like n=1 Tax=Styela clava TaxID=7725 RepID=UPI0019392AB1|nr:secretory carrier-associated membrane protein 1-like [Styela clava]
MSEYDANPFSDPFADQSVTNATANSQEANLEDYNPFASQPKSQPAVMEPSSNPPPYTPEPAAVASPQPPQQASAGHEELLRRQEELERKAEELNRREQQMNAGNFNPRANNWPPIPKFCPIGPCFFQDFSLDIPVEFQRTIKMLYYLWMYYVVILFINVFSCLAVFTQDSGQGVGFGLAILWFCLNAPCSMCWYRPAYSAFKSDSSFYFFFFFFIMFCQFVTSVVMCVGIPNSGYAGWILAFSYTNHIGVAIMCYTQAVLFTVNAVADVLLLKKVHSIYRTTGASFEKAQQEFASGVMKNPGVQRAAADAATAAVSSTINNK